MSNEKNHLRITDSDRNDKADKLAKTAAKGMVNEKVDFYDKLAKKKEIIQTMRSSVGDK